MTIGAATNEPRWLTIARENGAKYADGTPIRDADIPPPTEGGSALFVADCLNAAAREDNRIPRAPETIAELAMYGKIVDVTKTVPKIGTIVLINRPSLWIPVDKNSAAARLTNDAKAHVGFLARSTLGQIYVLGDGAIRAFPRKAIGSLRTPF